MDIKLTQYSHGAGCGCKISPEVLSQILDGAGPRMTHPQLLVGNHKKDDAAVFETDNDNVIISTTDFFMPIVDEPEAFGRIASVNAISDIYAMGGKPIMAIAILGWPINEIPAEVAGRVLHGAQGACADAGIPLAGGHSIDAPEPIFGLAVTGMAKKQNVKANATAKVGDKLYLTKPLGVGIVTTAQKKGVAQDDHIQFIQQQMGTLNEVGFTLGQLEGVSAMTDVTGFGLGGHLLEMCEGSDVAAKINFSQLPTLDFLPTYLEQKTFPGGTQRNFQSYGHKISPLDETQKAVICDPQTSGGLLVAVDFNNETAFMAITRKAGLELTSFGEIVPHEGNERLQVVP
ncbi:MAG: selenide, water dikinase SelD [Myxococcales bacterium]|nr:selenide, water dikinase SelD [Myxococcales bacterium]|tara:strand:+ start:3360 stop:4394 length:1035 start_codon:yes stop_codon:yes gene_type:complete